MSLTLPVAIPSSSCGYTVEHRGDCVLVFGPVPISALVALTKLVPKNAVMDLQLQRIAKCTVAMGLRQDTKKLIEEMTPQAIENARLSYLGTGLTEAATRWLAIGERGASSDAMFLALTDIAPIDAKSDPLAHPYDPDDLRRCRLLLDQVPELADKLEKLSTISPVWARIGTEWESLCRIMDEESPDWRNGGGKAPRTYQLIKNITDRSVDRTLECPTL